MNKSSSIKTVIIIVLIFVIISLIFIILNMKNKNIEEQEIIKEQLGDATTNNSYIALSTHISELEEKQQQINNMQNTAGKATVTEDKILKDYTAYKNGQLITGTMANNGAVSKTLNAGGSYIIPAGYHNGNGKVTANSLASQTSATAIASDILSGKTAWVNGKLVTGTNIGNTFKYEVVSTTTSTTSRKINLKNEYKSMEYCFVVVNIDSNRKDTFSGSSITFTAPNTIICSTPTVSGSYSTTVIFIGN